MKTHLSAPGKAFILGEYAVLGGLPAVIAAVPPRFQLRAGESTGHGFHAESPAGRLLEYTSAKGVAIPPLEFGDPLKGAGGFGASTAQFALVYLALAEKAGWAKDWRSAWILYRELTRTETVP